MTVKPLDSSFAPGKIIALHLNYPSRIAQRGRSPQFPSYFLKPGTSLAKTGGTIERPAGTEGWSQEQLAQLVTRDAMIGTGLALNPQDITQEAP